MPVATPDAGNHGRGSNAAPPMPGIPTAPAGPAPLAPAFMPQPSGPPLPDPTTPAATAPAGVLRWEDMERRQAQILERGSPDYDKWIMSLKPDGNDPQYDYALYKAQEAARKRQEDRDAQAAAQAAKAASDAAMAKSLSPLAQTKPHDRAGKTGNKRDDAIDNILGFVKRKSRDPLSQNKPHDVGRYDQVIASWSNDPNNPMGAFTAPVNHGETIHDPNALPGNGDPKDAKDANPALGDVAKDNGFGDQNGVVRDDPQNTDPDKSSALVYWTTRKTSDGSVQHVYMTSADAMKYLFTLPPDVVKKIQENWPGNTVQATGYILQGDPIYQYWQKIVATAAVWHQMGSETSPMDFFEAEIQALIAKSKAGGGGGGGHGGGGGRGGAGAQGLAEYDYYQAMMQVLGDLSGLPNG